MVTALILCRPGAGVRALCLLLAALVVVIRWSVDVFSYFAVLVYLGGVLVMLLYFTRFVTYLFKVYMILAISVVVGGFGVFVQSRDLGGTLVEVFRGPVEILLRILVYLLWLLR